ncbi:MAG: NAD(P)H-hydrate epimerase [Clostridiales bacterium]|nr:NAD(P)H-hydrate epimerase [Clostridiales bacterium]
MQHVISVENMRRSDMMTISSGTPSLVLMERAARGIRASCIFEGKTVIVIGSGNNGGDGTALAEILASEGKDVRIVSVSDHFSEDSAYYLKRAAALGVGAIPFVKGTGLLQGADTVVDCLLGTGFNGEVRGPYKEAIDEINSSGSFVISADISSGMNGDTGEYVTAVRSDLTVTIGYCKKGPLRAFLKHDPSVGSLVCADIGIALQKEEDHLLDDNEWMSRGFPDGLTEYNDKVGHTFFRGTVPVIRTES